MPMLVPAFESPSLLERDAALQADYSGAPREGSLNSVWSWFLTPKSIRTDITCMKPPPPVHIDHVRGPGHSAGHAVSDDRRRGRHDGDCTDWNRDGGLGLRRGCDRRTRSSSLARRRVLPCSGRQERLVHNLRRSAQIDLHVSAKPCISAVPALGGVNPVARLGGVLGDLVPLPAAVRGWGWPA